MKISGEFIPDGMNSFERNVKRVGDCIIASILMMLFSPLFLDCGKKRGWWSCYLQTRTNRSFWSSFLHL